MIPSPDAAPGDGLGCGAPIATTNP